MLKEKFQTNRGLIIKIGSALVVVMALFGVMHSHAEGKKSDTPKVPDGGRPALAVHTVALRDEQWTRTLSATGSIVPWQEAVISAQVQGLRIAEVKVSIGDWVKRGQVLATLGNLAHGTGGSDVQGRIIAPDDGIISAAEATVGSMPQSGKELFRLIRQGRMEWRADLTADELMLIRKGMPVQISLGEGRTLKGSVRAISPSVDTRTRTGYALVSLADSSGIIAGVFARGVFDVSGGKRALKSLPQSAILQHGSNDYVLVVGEDSRVHEQPVSLGQRKGDRVEIKDGLKPDEQVVESGGPFLTEGDIVLVVKG